MMQQLKELLGELAKRESWSDDPYFCPTEQSGGNYDNAYWSGQKDGETDLARRLLKEFFSEN